MKMKLFLRLCLLAAVTTSVWTTAQDSAVNSSTSAAAVVPNLINYSGVLADLNGKPLSGIQGVTFLLYSDEDGGNPLWMETQNVTASKNGQYTVTLGSTTAQGLPSDLFANGEARWLGVQVVGQTEQARVLLVSVPYSMKAGDAQTLGGLPASAFMLANQTSGTSAAAATSTKASAASTKSSPPPANPAVTGKGTVDYIPMWDTTSDIVDSLIFQKSSEIGIGTTAPAATLDVNGKGDVRDTLTLFPKSTDSTLAVSGTTFKISSTGDVTFISGQTFPGAGTITGITTASGSGLSGGGTKGTLSLKIPAAGVSNAMLADSNITLNANTAGGLTTPGAMTLGSTYTIGLKPCSTSQVLQYSGSVWNCAAAGTGTISDVKAGTDLTGGGTSGSVTLNVDTTKVPQLSAANAFSAAQTINGPSTSVGLTVDSSGNISDPQAELIQNNTSDFARLRFTDAATTDYWDVAGLSGSTSELNFWNGTVGVNLLQLFQTYLQANANLQVTDSNGDGVDTYSASNGWGSFSEAATDAGFETGAAGWETGTTQQDVGVWGWSASSIAIGVYGEGTGQSATGMTNGDFPTGIWGDTSDSGGVGVFGSADDGWSLAGYNNSNSDATIFAENLGTGGTGLVLELVGKNGQCNSDVNGNFNCTGGVSAVAPVNGGSTQVALSAIHSAENWFEDAGSGQLSSGQAVVNVESVFGETVNTDVEYHVFLTPNGDCKGLYVAQKSANSFVVKELGGGTSNIAFDYRIMAKRKGFETVRLADRTSMLAVRQPKGSLTANKVRPDDVRKARLQKSNAMRKAAATNAKMRVFNR
jgi:hypothetical protein